MVGKHCISAALVAVFIVGALRSSSGKRAARLVAMRLLAGWLRQGQGDGAAVMAAATGAALPAEILHFKGSSTRGSECA